MSQEAELVQTRKMARTIGKIVNFLFWLLVIASAASVCGMVYLAFLPAERLADAAQAGNLSFVGPRWFTFRVPLESLTGDAIKTIMFVVVSMLMISALSWSLILRQLRSILKTVERNRPFTEENARRISVIGWILVVGSVVFSVAKAIAGEVAVRALDVVPGMTVTFQWDVSLALAGFCLLILAGVFRYGAYLQEEYDTTV